MTVAGDRACVRVDGQWLEVSGSHTDTPRERCVMKR